MIDTLTASNTLQENGFSRKQSEVLVHVIAQQNEELATKQDIQLLKKDMQVLRADMQALREDITKSIRHIFWLLALIFPVMITILVLFTQQ